ncbi:nitroreductase family protein [Mycolicibacterium komossense]|uniref:Nitroreductase family protein n=2 Tax=Mycolicibacterium komossense TaxID=1779 RepID=A0ABT3CHP8_9MYCO|nr:nitroreductase family protein [Mycolicibacterium komossense]
MELIEALRTTGAVREFTDEEVDDDVLHRVLDNARFAPSGGNAQSWRVVVVRDLGLRAQLRDLYLRGWYDYLAMAKAGLRPWAPTNDPEAEKIALAAFPGIAAESAANPGMAEHLDRAPVVLALFADMSLLAATDRDLGRYGVVGGASIYPFAWNVLLAGREEGLGGVITTMATREEAAVKTLLGAQDPLALAAVIALGYPVRQPRRLRRATVDAFTTVDRVDGAPFRASG